MERWLDMSHHETACERLHAENTQQLQGNTQSTRCSAMCGGLTTFPLYWQDDDPTPERPENLQTRLVEETQKPKKAKKQKSAGAAESLQEAADKPQAAAAATAAAADSVVQPQVWPVPCALLACLQAEPGTAVLLLLPCCGVHTCGRPAYPDLCSDRSSWFAGRCSHSMMAFVV